MEGAVNHARSALRARRTDPVRRPSCRWFRGLWAARRALLPTLAVFVTHAVLPASVRAAHEFQKVATIGVQFLKLPVGARAAGMGWAFTAIADDASCVYWNVGGLARISDRALAVNHTPWLADINFTQVTFVSHTRYLPGTFAVHARSLYMPEMEVRTVFRPEGEGTFFDAGDLALGIAYARSLTDKFSAGVGANFIESTLATYRGTAVTFDFGTLYDIGYRSFRIGMQIQNIGSDLVYIEEPVKVPTLFRVGMSTRLLERHGQKLVAAGEFSHPPDNSERANVGGEYSFFDTVFLRAGWFYRFDTERFSLGAGLRLPIVGARQGRFDYAFTELDGLPAVHRFSAEFRF